MLVGPSFTPDSKHVVVAYDKRVEVLDLEPAGSRKIGPMSGNVSFVGFSQSGDVLAVGTEDGHAVLHDAATLAVKTKVDAAAGPVQAVRISRNGKTGVVLGDSPKARFFQPADGKVIREVEMGMNPWDAGISVDGKRVTLIDAAGAAEFEVATGRQFTQQSVDTGATFPVATSADGAWVASSSEDGHALSLWNVHPWTPHPKLVKVDSCTQHVGGIWFSADGKLLFASQLDGPRLAFKVESRAQRALWVPKKDKGEVVSAVMSEDADTGAASSAEGGTRLFRTSDGAPIRSLEGSGAVAQLTFSGDGKLLLGVKDGRQVVVWSVATGKVVTRFEPPK